MICLLKDMHTPMITPTIQVLVLAALSAAAMAAPLQTPMDLGAKADGVTDDTAAFMACFEAAAKAGGGTLTVPAGNYFLSGVKPIPLTSDLTVSAYGARFLLPKDLGDKARITLFSGTNIQRFSWQGGEFIGHCFDHKRQPNTWEPNVTTRMLVIETTPDGTSSDLTFRDIRSDRVAGAVVSVFGALKKGSDREVDRFATQVTLDNCTLIDSGRFMWDYGLLWQIVTWPEDYAPEDVAMAKKYFRNDSIREGLKFEGDRINFDNAAAKPLVVSATGDIKEKVTFFGEGLPPGLIKGKGYCIVAAGPDHIKVSDAVGGAPISFSQGSGGSPGLMYNLMASFYGLYAPTGSGSGKGCFDLVGCKGVRVTGCKISALGDTMHIQRSHDVVFSSNHILGSRMGAFFLAEFCKNAVISGNIVDGGNGSRVISIEKSCEDVTMTGNTFRNGGRGAWINQPKNLVISGNVFVNNTTKGEADPWRGRRSHQTGDYLKYPEMYFTQYEPEGSYGNVLVKDNLFITGEGASAAITIARGGSDITIEGNHFQGAARTVVIEKGAERVKVSGNTGSTLQRERLEGESLMFRGRPRM